MAHPSNYFSNLSNTVINNPMITHVNGNASISSSERFGLRVLLDKISRGAFHDAAERGDPPKCHPETRVAIREEIMEWIKAPEAMHKPILWMYGPAGSGKTAIAQSIAEECNERGLLAASFFGRLDTGHNDTTRVVATLAYQISRFLPQVQNDLFSAIEKDSTIFSRTLVAQMQALVVGPLKSLPPSLCNSIFVILDGVDEIGPDPQSQATLLDVIGMAISELQHIPLKFLIASRPEYEIRKVFAGPFLQPFTRPLELDSHYNPDADIRLYFNSSFRRIHAEHLQLGTHLPSPWPSEGNVNRLVSKASGQFIFALTVMKFVDSVRFNPAQQLDIIMGLSTAGDTTPFALLDTLYRHILSSVADLPQVLEILTVLLLTPGFARMDLTIGVIDKLLGIEVRRALVDMHALVFVPPPTDDYKAVRIHHASLYDFLLDQSRSNEYYIDKIQGHINLGRRWLKFMGNSSTSTGTSLRQSSTSFIWHSNASPANSKIADDLVYFNLRLALEETPLTYRRDIQLMAWNEFFNCVKRQIKTPWWKFLVSIRQQFGDRADIVARLQGELSTFITDCISKYPQRLRGFIPAILTLRYPGGIFDELTRAVGPSSMDVYESGYSDQTLLYLSDANYCYGIICQFFEDASRAGYYYVHGGSYLALAKQIFPVKFPNLPGGGRKVQLQETPSRLRSINQNDFKLPTWFGHLLFKVPTDFDLARLLLNRALQYNRPYPSADHPGNGEADEVALASLMYVERCGLPYLEHTHPEGTNACVICNYYGDNDS